MKAPETLEQQQRKDSDMIFTQITSGGFDSVGQAHAAVCRFYVFDETISRAGISDALVRLEKHYGGSAK